MWTSLKNLPDPWRVFHHVEWEGQRSGRHGDGEADFVLLHPSVGLIVVEVKGGSVAVGGGQWYSFDRKGQRHAILDPFEQAKTSKYSLIEHLKASVSQLSSLPAGHAVAFPDLKSAETLGLNAPKELMVTGRDLAEPQEFIDRISRHWEIEADLPSEIFQAMSDVLAPTATLRRTAKDDLLETSAQIERWTKEQLGALDALARNPRQLIYGIAGTGKTVLAQEKARRLAAAGKKTLLTCYNQPLANALQSNLGDIPEITVATFHALCKRLASQASHILRSADKGGHFDRSFPDRPTQAFWDNEAADLLVAAADFLGFHVDALVVDEGQDFSTSWFDALELLLAEPAMGEFYMFADTHQAIYRTHWEPPFEGPAYDLRMNCRNTLPIAIRVAAIFGDEPSALGAGGQDPEFMEVVNQEGAVKAIRQLLHLLLNDGKLDRDQVAILCQRKSDVELLRGLELAGHPMAALEGWGDGVLVETIHRFKGLEADVCIVVLFETARPWDQALAYIGISRARARLFVIGPPAIRDSLIWS